MPRHIAPYAIALAALALLGLGVWLWSRVGLAVWLDAAIAFCM